HGITTIVGFVDANDHIYNAAAIISDGKLVHVYHKILLPNYGVFDEYRYFKPGRRYPIISIRGVNIGVNVCEDIWFSDGPARTQALAGAEIIIAINASPYHKGKGKERIRMLASCARGNNVYVVYTNAVGGQDELVFDGHSLIFDQKGKLLAAGRQFDEELITADINLPGPPRYGANITSGLILDGHREFIDSVIISATSSKKKPLLTLRSTKPYSMSEEVYHALVLGTRDYVKKTGFKSVVIGLSGGVDSSLVASIAVAAIGNKNVFGVFMPSQYSSYESRDDAVELARRLGITMIT